MVERARREDAVLIEGLSRWCGTSVKFTRPHAGWCNETLLVQGDRPFVVRLPPLIPAYPVYDLGAQAQVLDTLAEAGIPVPRVIALEEDTEFLGAPFLAMSLEPGRPGPEAPALDPWLVEAPIEAQGQIQRDFIETLASVHRVDWARLGGTLRDGGDLTAEVGWWREYIDWATDGAPPARLVDAVDWCARTVPSSVPVRSLCWGDTRIGNFLFSDGYRISSLLDWELATIGPAEMDMAWYLVLDELLTTFTGRTLPGYLDRNTLIAGYEAALGRRVQDLVWHEIFALVRSVAITERLVRIAEAGGLEYPGEGGDRNPVMRHLDRRIESFAP
jgi:aminoglycoside phosphotransferase (APT) family kinase protein